MDWKRFMALQPDDLTDADKDELFNSVVWFDLDEAKINWDKMKHLFKVTQEILKYKNEQVESLVSELDEIATRQGEEEAQSVRRIGTTGRESDDEYDNFKGEYLSMKSKMKEQSVEIQRYSKEIDKLTRQINFLEREKSDLQTQLQTHQSAVESDNDSSETTHEGHRELVENIHQKNRHISELLTDVELLERDNIVLRENLMNLKEELASTTGKMANITGDLNDVRQLYEAQKDKNSALDEENNSLKVQLHELSSQRQQQHEEIEKLSTVLDEKIDEWKQILETKDEEIEEWKSRYNGALLCQTKTVETGVVDDDTVETLTRTIESQEDKIEELERQLREATVEMNETAALIERMRETSDDRRAPGKDGSDVIEQLKAQVRAANERVKLLQERVADAEDDACHKAEEASTLIKQLRDYEDGNYGLSEAILNIQELKSKVHTRDKQIEELVRLSNRLQTDADKLEMENLSLRNSLGLPIDASVRTGGVATKLKSYKRSIQKLQTQVETFEEEKIRLTLENRRLGRTISQLTSQVDALGAVPDVANDETDARPTRNGSDDEPKTKHDEKHLDDVVAENEALRKGMHEILDSIQEQAAKSELTIKSDILERLLKALDIRHVSGWYHPAMRLQAEVFSLQGGNLELRDQLQAVKSDAERRIEQLQNEKLEAELNRRRVVRGPSSRAADVGVVESTDLPVELSLSSAEIIHKQTCHLLHVLNEYHSQEEKNIELNKHLETYRKQLNTVRHQLGLLYKEYNDEKRKWTLERKTLEGERTELNDKIDTLASQLDEVRKNVVNDEPNNNRDDRANGDVQKYATDDSHKRLLDLIAEHTTLQRKYTYLETEETRFSSRTFKLKQDLLDSELYAKRTIGKLEQEKEQLLIKNRLLERTLSESVHGSKYDSIVRDNTDVARKYREVLEQQNCIGDGFRNRTEVLELKAKDHEAAIDRLKRELLDTKTELYALRDGGADATHDGKLSERFAELEIKTMSETQRANHADNLMRVIQDQLKRSEERFAEVLSQNNALQIKNVELRRHETELQDRLVGSVDADAHDAVRGRVVALESEAERWKTKYFGALATYRVCRDELKFYRTQKFFNDDETVALKHQLLDLQAVSDDRALIARLEADAYAAKKRQSETDALLENLGEDVARLTEALDAKSVEVQRREEDAFSRISQLNTKCRNLENILHSQRQRYAGSAPLITVEHVYESLKQASIDSQNAYEKLLSAERTENDVRAVNEELVLKMQLIDGLRSVFEERNGKSVSERLMQWHQERNELKINELKYCRQIEFKDNQLQQAFIRLNKQECAIQNLQREMLRSASTLDDSRPLSTIPDGRESKAQESPKRVAPSTRVEETETSTRDRRLKCAETQTITEHKHQFTATSFEDFDTDDLDNELKQTLHLLSEKTANLKNCESRVNELERLVHDLRKDLALTQEELLTTKKPAEPVPAERTNVPSNQNDQISSMKAVIIDLQKIINQKEETVVLYQNMLKERRDEHGKAAELFQSEIQQLQAALLDLKQENEQLKTRDGKEASTEGKFQNRPALEKYVEEVHVLETHVGELHTAVHSLESQLSASQQEAMRWKSLSEDRLSSMDKLRVQLETQHQTELECYKNECTKWRDESEKSKQELSKLRMELNQGGVNVAKIINDKDNLIHELQLQLNEFKDELRRYTDKPPVQTTPQMIVLEGVKKKLQADNESLKKQLNALTNKEKTARDEIQSLKGQLLRRPILSARSDRSTERSNVREQQLQKKVATLETEIADVKQKLEKETAINEMRRARNADELALWDKQKRWQQTAEKLRDKLKTKTVECERLDQSVASMRGVVSRLEREKHVLESKLKVLRGSQTSIADNRIETLELDNVRLTMEVEALTKKLEMQQHHSGGLGAAMMEEKLESQERKIAVLELASKGNSTLLAELERLQAANGALQKDNLRLQGTNLEMKLELEKNSSATPRLREQIGHLEKYVEVLKAENMQHVSSAETGLQSASNKKIGELEKTVFVLKRIIEKQQVELKRVHSPKTTTGAHTMTTEKLKSELYKSHQQLKECAKRIAHLEQELQNAHRHIKLLENGTIPEKPDSGGNMAEEIADLRAQLKQKCDLLDKVKLLLHKAAVKERALDEQIKMLKSLVPQESSSEPTSKSQ